MTQEYAYQVKAINNDYDTCECCGKTNLQKVVWIVEVDSDGNETGDPVAYGTQCAAKKMGFNSQTKAQAQNFVTAKQAEYKEQARAEYFKTQCIIMDTPFGKVFVDRKFRIGQIAREQGIDRNQAINWARNQMKSQWFME